MRALNITRDYGINVRDRNNNPVEDVQLTTTQGNTTTWTGQTDSFGRNNMNATFTDSNCTSVSELNAVKGVYSASANVSFLSSTLILLTLQYFTDLNGDGLVNILDITIVATTYDSKPEDQNWNSLADLDKSGVVNIIDISMVAKDFGKSV